MNNNTLLKTLITIGIITLLALVFTQNRDLLGDVNSDGEVNILDVVRVVNIILENGPVPTDYELWASDVNADQITDISDIIVIVQVIINNGNCQYLHSPCAENLSACCPDTTSHYFIWSRDTIGIYGSQLRDVAIIDENNIWVVGEIRTEDTYQFDSTGTWVQPYNAAHWNGEEWINERIVQPGGYVQPLNCIDYISENNIWFGKGSLPIQWNGNEYYLFTPVNDNYPGGNIINRIYHLTLDDIFIIGNNGSIVRYDGAIFQLMDSGTDVDLKDIHGTEDGEFVFAVGYEDSGESIALKLSDGEWQEIYSGDSYFVDPETSVYGRISAVEVNADTAYFTTTAGLLKYVISSEDYIITAEDQSSFYNYHFVDISMNEVNDIMLFSRVFSFLHYNGNTWLHDESNSEVYDTWTKGGDFVNNIAVAVGYCCGGVAYVVRGNR